MVGNSGRDQDQESKSDPTGYPSPSLVSTSRDDPRKMRDTPIASEEELRGHSLSQPKTFARTSRIREASRESESFNLPPYLVLQYEMRKGVSNVASNPSQAWLLVDFGSK